MSDKIFTYPEFLKHKILSDKAAIIPNHMHNNFEISYFISGTGQIIVGNTVYNFKPHSIFITPPKMIHSLLSEHIEVIYIGFFYDNSLGVIDREMFIESDSDDIFLTILSTMKTIYENQNIDKLAEARLLELQKILLYTILKNTLKENRNITNDALSDAYYYLKKNYSKNIDIEKLAVNIGYSYHRFRHLFKKKFGISPNQFLLNERLSNAMQMLSCTSQTVKSIALCCGFKSTSNLISSFKKHNKITPSEYRNSIKNNIETFDYFKHL